jgi:hypothetical protein
MPPLVKNPVTLCSASGICAIIKAATISLDK